MSDDRILLGLPDYRKLSGVIAAMKAKRRPLEPQIKRLERELRDAEVVETPDIDSVYLGAVAFIRDMESGDSFDVRIVFPAELDGTTSTVSIFSPLGVALIGERTGASIRYETPSGTKSYKLVAIKQAAAPRT